MKSESSRNNVPLKEACWGWLYFEDPKTEKAYVDYIADINAGMSKTAGNLLVAIGVVYVAIVGIYNISLQYDDYTSTLLRAGRISLTACVLRMTPKKFIEWTMVAAETFLGCGLIFSNVFRLRRQSRLDEIPALAGNAVWENCDDDLAVNARDSLLACGVLFTRAICCNLFRVRTKLAWVVPVCESICFAYVLFSPANRLDDGGTSHVLFAIVTSASIGIFIGNRPCLFYLRVRIDFV